MAKRIVFCFDGTWDNALKNDNVYRLYKALLVTSDQVTFYDDGVGADTTGLQHILDGAFAATLPQKVMDGYTKIAHVFEAGDQVYLFGFSRGAYTARSVAGMIADCGLPTGSFADNSITQAFAAYRDPVNRAAMLQPLTASGFGDATVQMVGVWETVGAMGIPAVFGGIDMGRYGFLDTNLHPDVKSAYHAVAVDEFRPQFPATLWTSAPAAGQTLEQVWFSGCHSDVGGGTPMVGGVDLTTQLSDISLGWMYTKAVAQGLTFDPAAAAQFTTLPSKFALDAIHESYKPQDGPVHLRPVPPGSHLANSIGVRLQYALAYNPANLTFDSDDRTLADGYEIIPLVDEDSL